MRCPTHPDRRGDRRGVCRTCYSRYSQRVSRGLDTWLGLVLAGYVLPPGKAGRPAVESLRVRQDEEQSENDDTRRIVI